MRTQPWLASRPIDDGSLVPCSPTAPSPEPNVWYTSEYAESVNAYGPYAPLGLVGCSSSTVKNWPPGVGVAALPTATWSSTIRFVAVEHPDAVRGAVDLDTKLDRRHVDVGSAYPTEAFVRANRQQHLEPIAARLGSPAARAALQRRSGSTVPASGASSGCTETGTEPPTAVAMTIGRAGDLATECLPRRSRRARPRGGTTARGTRRRRGDPASDGRGRDRRNGRRDALRGKGRTGYRFHARSGDN